MTEMELTETVIDLEDEDLMDASFTDDEPDDFENTTWEWDGAQWQKVA
jgi:hypothetical protein